MADHDPLLVAMGLQFSGVLIGYGSAFLSEGRYLFAFGSVVLGLGVLLQAWEWFMELIEE